MFTTLSDVCRKFINRLPQIAEADPEILRDCMAANAVDVVDEHRFTLTVRKRLRIS